MVKGPANIHFTTFQTESGCDVMLLEIDGIFKHTYSGRCIPADIGISKSQIAKLTWRTDYSNTDKGWAFTVDQDDSPTLFIPSARLIGSTSICSKVAVRLNVKQSM